jgi:hypothetical protein
MVGSAESGVRRSVLLNLASVAVKIFVSFEMQNISDTETDLPSNRTDTIMVQGENILQSSPKLGQ